MDWIVGWLSVLQAVQALDAPQWIWAGTAGTLPHTRGFANTITAWGTCWHELSGAQSLLWLRAWQAPVPSMRLLMYQVTIVTQVLKSKTPLESWGSFDVETREAKAFATKLGTFPGRKKKGSTSLSIKDPNTINISNLFKGLLKLSEVKTYCIFALWKTFYGCLFL